MPKLQSFPEFDLSHSSSLGDDRRVVVMKGTLMTELVRQPPVLMAYMQWTVKAGLHQVPQAVRDGNEPVASLIAAIPSASQQLHEKAFTLAAALGLPYRWVARDLLHGFGAGLVGIATKQEIVLPLPQINVTLDPTKARPTGRRPDEEALARYARWYVLRRISGVSVNVLARDYHETHHTALHQAHTWKADRKTILHGIQEVERLLQLTR